MTGAVLGIDPGTRKSGVALVTDAMSPPLLLCVEPLENLTSRLRELLGTYPVRAIALGRGTHAQHVGRLLAEFDLPVHLVDERETTLRARALYFADHPPRGWRWFIPLGLQLPPRPIDDYAALLIARRFLEREAQGR